MFHALLDEDGARAIIAGTLPPYLIGQCEDFLILIDEGLAAGIRRQQRKIDEARQRAAK